jgi:peptidoglycan/xylan/chitin deacetylase (PgdA/CDA1 family)
MRTGLAFKAFPPRWGNELVPVGTREDALAGLTMYAASRPMAVVVQRLVWSATRLVGPWIIPSMRTAFSPPVDETHWDDLLEVWREEFGPFDAFAVHRPRDTRRFGLALLLLRQGRPQAFLKLRTDAKGSSVLKNEYHTMGIVRATNPASFGVVEPLVFGKLGESSYLASAPLPEGIHRTPVRPPLESIIAEIQSVCGSLKRPEGTPQHWVPMHGDLTPWNLRRFAGGNLFLLDWEKAGWGPPGSDFVLYTAASRVLGLRGRESLVRRSSQYDEAIGYWLQRWDARVGSRREEAISTGRGTLAWEMLSTLSAIAESSPDGHRSRGLEGLVSHRTKRRIESVLARRPSAHRAKRHAPSVLCYHSVHPTAGYGSVTPDQFEAQLRFLADSCDVVPLADVLSAAGRQLDRPTVAITFDDGYADNHSIVMPALLRYGFPATFFVTTGLVDHDPATLARFSYLLGVPPGEIETLGWAELAEMRDAGMGIGAHTVSHPNFMHGSPSDTLMEMQQSKATLEDRLGLHVDSFAYPFGKPGQHLTSATAELASEAGFDVAVTTLFRRVRTADSSLLIPRFHVTRDSMVVFEAKLLGKLDVIGAWQEFAPSWAMTAISDDVSSP